MKDSPKKIPKKFHIANTPANNFLMLLGGAFLIVILVSLVDTSIIRTSANSAKGYTLTLKNNYQKLLAENMELQNAKQSSAILKEQFNQLLAKIPRDTKIDDVLESMTKIGTNLGLKIVSFKPQETTKTNFSKLTPINISVVGDFNHMAQFISGVANLPYLLTIRDFDISRENPTANNLSMNMSIVVVQYHDPAQGEKK